MNIHMYDSRIAVPWTYWLALASGVAGFNHWRRLSSPMSPGIITPLWGSFRTFVGQGRCPVGGVLSGPCTPSPLGTHHRLLCARFGRTCIPALQRIRCCPGTLGPGATVWKPCHAAPSMAGNGVSPGNDATPGGQGPARRHPRRAGSGKTPPSPHRARSRHSHLPLPRSRIPTLSVSCALDRSSSALFAVLARA